MPEAHPETIGMASLNLLIDKTRSTLPENNSQHVEHQYQRIDSLSRALGSLPISLDVVMLQEVHITKRYNNGEQLMENLGIDKGFWVQHNELSRKDEYLGVIGHAVDSVEAFDVGDNRKALLTMVGGIALVGIHNRSGLKQNRHIRVEQTKKILDRISEFDKAVIIGDSNELPWQEPRLMLSDAGFTSVYKMRRKLLPAKAPLRATFPTRRYRKIMLTPAQLNAFPVGAAIDLIDLRGFERSEVIKAGVRTNKKSDHKTLYAKLAPK